MHLHSLLQFSHANRAVLKLRDQKQMDFEDLSEYLSNLTAERDRLDAVIHGRAGSTGLGLGAYLKDRVDALRGADDDRSRVDKMGKLEGKIKELEDAVTVAHDTSDAFSEETLREQKIFQCAKEAEMKELLGNLADGQIEFYKAVGGNLLCCLRRVGWLTCPNTGYGGVGAHHPGHTTHSGRRMRGTRDRIGFVLSFACVS